MTSQRIRSVLVAHDRPDDIREMLGRRFPDVHFVFATSDDGVAGALAHNDPAAVFSVQHVSFSGAVLRDVMLHPSVKWLHVGGSGYDHLLPWPREDIRVTTGTGVLAPFLAEAVFAGILALNGNLLLYGDQKRRQEWRPHSFRPLHDQTLLIVGLGSIGRSVARIAKAVGMRVMAIRRSASFPDATVDEIYPPSALNDIIGRADIVSLHVRLTQETAQMVDGRWLRAMKSGAILVNTSRGAVIDETALIEALDSGHLRGAYLDVFVREPLPAESRLWSLPNVLITPHVADSVTDWPQQYAMRFAENLERWNDDKSLLSEISTRLAPKVNRASENAW
jgi:phosphoglycerate dehydrogenase-like enzyme